MVNHEYTFEKTIHVQVGLQLRRKHNPDGVTKTHSNVSITFLFFPFNLVPFFVALVKREWPKR